jgi:DNA-binding transcriptional ArsR family regulator
MSGAIEAPTSAAPDTDRSPIEAPEPVLHGCRVGYHHDDLELYEAVRSLWYDRAGSPDEEPIEIPIQLPDDYPGDVDDPVLLLTSSRWKAGRGEGDDYTAFYQYNLKLRDATPGGYRTPPISISIDLLPQFDGMVYPDGNPLDLPHGEGTRVEIQTTYPDGPDDVLGRAAHALAHTVEEYDATVTDASTATITKLEAHIRFDEELLERTVKTLDASRDLVAWGGDAGLSSHQQRQQAGWLEAAVRTDRWDRLGFDATHDREALLKVYRMQDWADRPADDYLRHPKLEAADQGGDDRLPLDEWDDRAADLKRLVAEHSRWIGIEREDLVADPHFGGPDAPSWEYEPTPPGRRDDLRAMYRELECEVTQLVQHDAAHDVLDVIARRSGATYDVLEEQTGLSRSAVRYHVRKFAEAGIVERVGNPVVVVFDCLGLLDRVEDALDALHAGETAADRLEELQERAEERRERRRERDAGNDADGDTDADTDRSRDRWDYLDDLPLRPHDVADEVVRGALEPTDVRVRTAALPPPSDRTTD